MLTIHADQIRKNPTFQISAQENMQQNYAQ
jgi:hypothetical protein